MRAILGLGSNLGDRRDHLRAAVDSLPGVVSVSDLYETEPVGGPEQGPYLNLVAVVETDLTPRELLALCHRLESAAERVRDVRWGPRTLDVDLLWVDTGPVDEPDLQIPHPRMHQRRFVMAPLLEVAPELVPADWEDRVEGRAERLGPL
jgi:2-amino-4-hydroxy-6-hydroxymethyldihydropteridine diphosphokinase